MTEPAPPRSPDAVPIESRALRDIRYIREAMERASEFTAVPGWGGIGMGAVALLAWAASALRDSEAWWLVCWTASAPLAVAVGSVAMHRKARRLNVPLTGPAGRRFSLGLVPPLVAGGVMTPILYLDGHSGLIPGVWLLLYGTGIVTGGVNSVRVVPVMGLCFMALGTLASLTSLPVSLTLLGTGFGGLHIVFGGIILRRYGG